MKKKIFIFAMFLCFLFMINRTDILAETNTSQISVNSLTSDSLSSGNEKLYYFSLTNAGKVSITFLHANLSTTSRQWSISIHNFENDRLLQMDAIGTETNGTSADVGLPAGEYYVKVYAWHSGTESYSLKVNYSASDYWEKENNNGYGYATDILVNTQYSGALQSNLDYDYYVFTIANPGKVSINFQHPVLHDNGTYWYAEIYNEKTEKLLQLKIHGTGSNITSAEVGLEAGKYYLKIYTYDWSNATYNVKINYSISNTWESENNDGYGTADEILLNTQYSGANQFESDDDYYKIYLPDAGKININFQHPVLMDNNTYWKIYLYNEKTDKILDKSITGTEYSVATAEVGLSAGYYYLVIDTNYFDSSTYNFTVNYMPSNVYESEVNNGYAEADVISIGTTYYGVNQMRNDEDYYVFTLSSPQTIKINFSHPYLNDDSWYWRVNLYNAQANKIDYLYVRGTETTVSGDVLSLSAGNYYVKIESYNSHSTATYGLNISYNPPIATPNLTASSSYDKILLKWNAVNDIDGYCVYASRSYDDSYSEVLTIDNRSITSYVDTVVSPGQTYYYKIRTYRDVSGERRYGEYSNIVSGEITLGKVSITSAKAGKRKGTIKWKKVTGASGYEVYMSTRKNSGYKMIKTLTKASKVQYTKSNLKKKKNYFFKVRAFRTISGRKLYGNFSVPKKIKAK